MQFRSSHEDSAGSSAADDEDQAVGQQSRRAELADVLKPGTAWNIPARGLNTASRLRDRLNWPCQDSVLRGVQEDFCRQEEGNVGQILGGSGKGLRLHKAAVFVPLRPLPPAIKSLSRRAWQRRRSAQVPAPWPERRASGFIAARRSPSSLRRARIAASNRAR